MSKSSAILLCAYKLSLLITY